MALRRDLGPYQGGNLARLCAKIVNRPNFPYRGCGPADRARDKARIAQRVDRRHRSSLASARADRGVLRSDMSPGS